MPPVAAFFGAVGSAVGIGTAATATVGASVGAVVAGGVIVGAVAGAAIAAATGGNIWKGALIGGVIGGTLGFGISGMAPALGVSGAGGTGSLGGINAGVGAQLSAGGSVPGGAATAVTTTGLTSGEALMASAALQGVSGAYSKKIESDALKEQERMKIDQENRLLDAQKATPGGVDVLTPKITNTPWANTVQAAGSLSLPGTVTAPTVTATGAQQVAPGSVAAGFNNNLFAPKLA